MNWEALVAALLAAVVALFAKPFIDQRLAKRREAEAFWSQKSDRVRDFQQSIAVLDSITHNKDHSHFPVDSHIDKIAIPDDLLPIRILNMRVLDKNSRKECIHVSNRLANITRDCRAIKASKCWGNREGYFAQVEELSGKMKKFVKEWDKDLFDNAQFRYPVNKEKKKIIFENGEARTGVAPISTGVDEEYAEKNRVNR